MTAIDTASMSKDQVASLKSKLNINKLTAAQKTILANLIEVTGFSESVRSDNEAELFIQLTIEHSLFGCSTIGISLQDEVYENDASFKAFRTFYGMAIATEVYDINIEELSDLDAEMFLQSQIEAELSAVEA
jgi:hypothetical protein